LEKVDCVVLTLATKSYTLPLHKLTTMQFVHTVGVHSLTHSLNITAQLCKFLRYMSTSFTSLLIYV